MDRSPVVRTTPLQVFPEENSALTTEPEYDIIPGLPDETDTVTLTLEQMLEVEELVTGIPLGDHQTSLLSIAGHTMDTYIIANTQSAPVRAFFQAGKLAPVAVNETEGEGLAAIPVTTYYAQFTDRDRELIITEETYRAMVELCEPHNEVPTEEGLERIQTNMEPISADRQSSQEQAVDGHGRTKPYREDTRFPARFPATIEP